MAKRDENMSGREKIMQEIYSIEDRIRQAPASTPNKVVFDWYTEIDRLRERL